MKDFAPRPPAAKAAEPATGKGAALADNRASTVAQRKLQDAIASSPRQVAQRQATPRPNRTGLPDQLKAGVESLSGYSLDDVKVHYNSAKPAQLQALAYAQGTDIHLGPGQEKHLPHEAWHVVQQKQGRVRATRQMSGMGVNDDSSLEKEADAMGMRALKKNAYKNIQKNGLASKKYQFIRVNTRHRKRLNPTLAELYNKPRRGSDVPLFTRGDLPGSKLSNKIRNTYNKAVNLITYKPINLRYPPLLNSNLHKSIMKIMDEFKKSKEPFSDAWKKNYMRYGGVEYDDKDPNSEKWMNNKKLEASSEMKKARSIYMKEAMKTLSKLTQALRDVKKSLKAKRTASGLSEKEEVRYGRRSVQYDLSYAQKKIDNIVREEWGKTRNLGIYSEGGILKYIGSTNSGHKSITKAHVQFNPQDFDVDGQLVHRELYKALALEGITANKNRYFVREVSRNHISNAQLNRAIQNILLFAERMENRLTKEVNGIHKDKSDEFDLAIVR